MLENIEFFTGTNPELLVKIEAEAIRQNFEQGDFIFTEGAVGASMFVIISGSVEVFRKISEENKKQAELVAGDFFGETALVTTEPRSATVIAKESVECLEIGKVLFDQIFGVDPELSLKISKAIMSRIDANSRAEVIAGREQ